ncbi:UDP-N-acetylmuramoyl-L-alanyl-D-glutamate--2,6-diaminopimelate ligase [Mucilaginibacter sp. AW1-7]|jgi:UDP-N-acetylmuramoyl-L-alanyl-D-glutamate--2,6-diaminopimelate ligase|uniref:UDP-N-acetylmuramoyl-L-alanyl-D-glutamate--2, 6-diaminopimelate ligase n=1 Tax=unclassified Mucilaginibacter TaxID=2617802 RepID=UPI0008AFC638|nr:MULTISPECIES: UDP-N-acetylmuramoyl-L-alanyl-D-glutamate--2,6-diaminopimelate ligase [unclassified Mucilaginibacter]WDF76706.1 UDP-N-acetylmuramoyl-L-alanyl-D-glutamate--2,6-diaminopimelate ligase [Mucilaginibacter sp. KACC 22773]SEP38981.1 UDP-N-acetylmuramoylalanyl-D-glutamate--2,6-diaminopimelate ligase [Mucilaginibacter sp. OK283]
MRYLSDLIDGLAFTELQGSADVEITSVAFDSRQVIPGSMFVAVKGTQVDGHDYIDQAIKQGAIAVICEDLPAHTAAEVDFLMVADSAKALSLVAANFYGNPSAQLKLVGVTGTNGKTTIATLLYQLFRDLGYKAGLLSTVENQINGQVIPSTHTTPDPIELNRLLEEMVTQGCDYCFMEVSSHAVAQHRVANLHFSGGVFTNLTHDHLDYHKTFDSYLKAKKAFFDGLPKSAFALTNSDDKNGNIMLQNSQAHRKTYGLKSMADYKARILENQFGGLLLHIDNEEVWFKMVGTFNAYNLLAVYATAMLLEQDKAKTLTSLSKLTGAEGRFEYIVAPNKVIGIVDYAHTPDAVQNVLSTIHDIRKGNEKVITVIGCGGDRDKTKRPIMARVASEWSDKVILTSDNPRSEDPAQIIKDMIEGVDPAFKRHTVSIVDRREAIKTACMLANPGDIILVAGKGHEKYQESHGVKNHFDDMEELEEQFKLLV